LQRLASFKRPTKKSSNRTEDEMNVFASDMVSTAYILDALKDVKDKRAIVKLEVEDMLIAKCHHSLLPAVKTMIANDDRPWKYLKFVDTIDASDLTWWQEMKHALMLEYETAIDDRTKYDGIVSFQANVQINAGANRSAVYALFKIIEDDLDLQQVEFSGALFGYDNEDIAGALSDLLVDNGHLQEGFVVTVKCGWTSLIDDEPSCSMVLRACQVILHGDQCKFNPEFETEEEGGSGPRGRGNENQSSRTDGKRRSPRRSKSNDSRLVVQNAQDRWEEGKRVCNPLTEIGKEQPLPRKPLLRTNSAGALSKLSRPKLVHTQSMDSSTFSGPNYRRPRSDGRRRSPKRQTETMAGSNDIHVPEVSQGPPLRRSYSLSKLTTNTDSTPTRVCSPLNEIGKEPPLPQKSVNRTASAGALSMLSRSKLSHTRSMENSTFSISNHCRPRSDGRRISPKRQPQSRARAIDTNVPEVSQGSPFQRSLTMPKPTNSTDSTPLRVLPLKSTSFTKPSSGVTDSTNSTDKATNIDTEINSNGTSTDTLNCKSFQHESVVVQENKDTCEIGQKVCIPLNEIGDELPLPRKPVLRTSSTGALSRLSQSKLRHTNSTSKDNLGQAKRSIAVDTPDYDWTKGDLAEKAVTKKPVSRTASAGAISTVSRSKLSHTRSMENSTFSISNHRRDGRRRSPKQRTQTTSRANDADVPEVSQGSPTQGSYTLSKLTHEVSQVSPIRRTHTLPALTNDRASSPTQVVPLKSKSFTKPSARVRDTNSTEEATNIDTEVNESSTDTLRCGQKFCSPLNKIGEELPMRRKPVLRTSSTGALSVLSRPGLSDTSAASAGALSVSSRSKLGHTNSMSKDNLGQTKRGNAVWNTPDYDWTKKGNLVKSLSRLPNWPQNVEPQLAAAASVADCQTIQ
jgi:hypothetical protein